MTTSAPLRTQAVAAGRDYKTLPAWQKSMALTLRAFTLTEDFPAREHAGLAASIRSCARQMASQIALASAEANETGMAARYADAQGAAAALATDLFLAAELGYISAEDSAVLNEDLDSILRLIIAMKHGLKVQARDDARTERDAERNARDHEYRNRPREERSGEERPRREYKPRDAASSDRPREYKPREDRDRKPYVKREGDDRPRREYKPREDRDRKPYAKRDGDKPFRKPREEGASDRPRREYKPREERGGDNRGPRKPFGKR